MDALAAVAAAAPESPSPSQRLTEEARWTCVVLHKQRWMRTGIAIHLGCSRNTVAAVLARWRTRNSPRSGSRTGRPRIMSEQQDEHIASPHASKSSPLRAKFAASCFSMHPPAPSTAACRKQAYSGAWHDTVTSATTLLPQAPLLRKRLRRGLDRAAVAAGHLR
jgi:hypothetical protein